MESADNDDFTDINVNGMNEEADNDDELDSLNADSAFDSGDNWGFTL